MSAAKKTKPGPRTAAAIEKAIQSNAQKPVRVSTDLAMNEGTLSVDAPHSDAAGNAIFLKETFGSSSTSFSAVSLGSLEWMTRPRSTGSGESPAEVNAGLALIGAIAPQDELEAALALQMAGCHALAVDMLARAKSTDRTDRIELYGNMAVKMQRTFTAQIETLGRMRGKGQQTVRVEHVTVQPGAQAIVGDVHHHPPGATGVQPKTEDQAYGTGETAPAAEVRKALPSPDAPANGVPITSDAERTVPNPRRVVTRRANRKSKRP
jgi:hypothetical protein